MMSEGAVIRGGRPEDAEPCAAILNAWIDDTPWMPRVHPAEDVARHYREFVFVKRRVHVADAGNGPLGYVALSEEGEVTSLYIRKDTRGQGLGARLLDRAKADHARLSLWTFQANAGARRFYGRAGFKETDRSDGDNEEGLPDIQFGWAA